MVQKPEVVAQHPAEALTAVHAATSRAEALFLDRSNAAFAMRVQIGRTWRQTNRLDSSLLEHGPESLAMLAIAIHDDEPLALQEPSDRISEIPTDLHHPAVLGLGVAPAK